MSLKTWSLRRFGTGAALVAVAVSIACSGSGGGCGGMQPLPARYEGPKTDNAINIRISPNGINYLNQNWDSLIEVFAPGQSLNIPVPCTEMNVSVLGDIAVADQGSSTGSGRMNGRCTSADQPANVNVTVTGFVLQPLPPNQVRATIDLQVDTGEIYIASRNQSGFPGGLAICGFASGIKCSAEFDTNFDSPAHTRFDARVTFSIDSRWDKLLAFDLATPIDGTQICGKSGAPPSPTCIEPDDMEINGRNNCGVWCEGANIGFVKDFVLGLISPTLQDEIESVVAAQSCEQCGTGLPPCPQLANAASTCQDGICVDSATGECVPRFLGVEGRVAPGTILSGFGVPLEAELDVSVAAGSSVSVDQGINLGTRAGVLATQVASCVPDLPMPQLGPVTVPDFDAEAPLDMNGQPAPYHVGIGLSKQFLDLAMYHAHQSGSLCISMSSATTGMLNTGLFKTFLPSLGKLATRDGLDAPMMVVLKPARVPSITIGEGTFDPVTKRPIKPLIRLDMPDLTIDFYALLDDRFVRLFSLTADISIPLSVIFENCSSVTPALGDLSQLITNIRTANSEILAEDPKVLADLIPAIIGLAEPAVAGALQPFELPELGAFKLKVDATKGVTRITGTETYEHLGIYAQLMGANAMCATAVPKTSARLAGAVIPEAEQMRLDGHPLPWPIAILEVQAQGGEGTAEFAYKVDEGLWSTFLRPNARGELEVSHPALLLQGTHTLHIRSRYAETPHGISSPVAVPFVVDWEPPELSFTEDRARGVLQVRAHDVITPASKLLYAYRVGDGPPSAFGAPRVIDLEAVEAQGGVTVLVQDGSGNVAEKTWRAPTVALRAEGEGALADGDPSLQGAGCAASGAGFGLWALCASVGVLWRRRRARSR